MPVAELTGLSIAALCAAGVSALVNWWSVTVGKRVVEWVTKPSVMLFLIAAALTLHPADEAMRVWVVAGLVFSLAGDVFLMLPNERFVAGLASFFVAHVAYVVALVIVGSSLVGAGVGLVFVLVMVVLVASRVVKAVRVGHPELIGPVVGYVIIISAMVVAAASTTEAVAIAGAVLFYASDGILSYNRFVTPIPSVRPMIMSTYHLGQLGLTLSLVR